MRIGGLIIDIYDDVIHGGLKKIASVLPEDLKDHQLHTSEGLEKLSDQDFGAIIYTENGNKLRKYALDSKNEAIFSNAYFVDNKDKFTKEAQCIIARRIDRANKKFDIESDPMIEKMASEAPKEEWINLNKYPMQKVQKSTRVMEKTASANDYDSEYGDEIVFDSEIQKRKDMIKESSQKELDDLVQKKDTTDCKDFYNKLYEFDKTAGISRHWGTYVRHPFKACFSPKNKDEVITKIGNQEITDRQILEIAKKADGLKDILEDEAVEEFKKDPVTIFRSLPIPTQSLIVNRS